MIPTVAMTSGADLAVAAGTCAMAAITLGLFLYAAFQVRLARQLREEQVRPYIYVDFHVDDYKNILLTIENAGKTSAADVHFECTPGLKSSQDHNVADKGAHPGDFLSRRWSTIPPGKKVSAWFDSTAERFNTCDPDLVDTYQVTAHYRAPALETRALIRLRRRQPEEKDRVDYKDTFTLDLAPYRGRFTVRRKTIHDLVGVAEQLVQALEMLIDGTFHVTTRPGAEGEQPELDDP
jgi:hypothetical protein